MDFFEVIKRRKAIRKFTPNRKIPEEDIKKILEAINLAPSAKNLQSYKIYLAKDTDSIKKISHACYNQKEDFIRNAVLILVFCLDATRAEEHFSERGKNIYAPQDAAIAATYAVLSATSLGYGSCWVGNFKEDEMKKVLSTDLQPLATIVIGYPDEDPPRKPRKPLKELVEFI